MPELSILVLADADSGTISPNGEVKFKLGNTYNIEFQESKYYQFIKWEVLDKEKRTPLSNFESLVEINDVKSCKTTVKILKNSNNICIHPVCLIRPKIDNYSPQYKSSGESKDSSIILTFNHNISDVKGTIKDETGNEIEESIIVLSGDENLIEANYFLAPKLTDNIITIPANQENLLNVPENVKNITVKVPASLYYNSEYNEKVTMGTEYTFNYLVNNSTNDKAEITFSVLPEKGSISPNDTLKMNIGEKKQITFVPNKNYDFKGWSIKDSNDIDVPENEIFIEDKSALSTTITVLQKKLGVKITPISNLQLVPEVVTPIYSTAGVNFDTQIYINFNKSIESSYIKKENIHIYDIYGNELNNYFKDPEPILISTQNNLCNSFKMDFDYSKLDDFNEILNNYLGLMEIKVVLNKAITDSDGISLNEDFEYSYIVNESTEKIRPVINSLTLSKNDKTLLTSNYENWNEKDYNTNHINSFSFKCDASDVGSGVKTVTIKETVLFDVDNNPVNSSTTKTFDYKKDETQKYNFQSKIDGLIQLDFTVSDFMGNKSDNTMTYYVVKDTVFSVPVFIFTEAGDNYDQLKKDSTINDINVIRNGYYSIYFYYDSSESNVFKYGFDKWYNEYETNPEDYIYSITWGPEDNKSKYTAGNKEIHHIKYDDDETKKGFFDNGVKKSTPKYSSSVQTQTYFGFTFPKDTIDATKDTYYTIHIKDEAGNEFTLPNNVLLKQDKIISGEINPSVNTNINYYLSPDATNYTIYYEEKNITTGEVKLYRKTGSEFSDKLYSLDTENCEYTLYSVKHNKLGDDRYTSGLLSEGWVVSPSALEDGTDETLKNPDFDLNITNAGNENYKITITMDKETYSKYDSVQVYYGYTKYGTSVTEHLGVFDNSNVYELLIPYTKLLPKEGVTSPYYKTSGTCQMNKFGIRCIKDNRVYTSEKNTPDASEFAVDNIPPKITERYIYTASTKYVVYCSSIKDAFYDNKSNGAPSSGIAKNANGKCCATSYWINNINYGEFVDGYNGDKDSLAALEIDKSTILSAPKSEFEFSEGESSIFIPRPENTTVGSYLICIQIEDEAGNEYIGPIGFINLTLLNVKPTVEFESENNRNVGKYILQNGPKVQGSTKYTISKTIQYFDTTDNTWKYFTKNNGKYRTYIPSKSTQENGDDKGFEYMLWVGKTDAGANIEPGNENLFIRVDVAERLSANKQSALENLLNEGFQVAKPVYFYLSDTLCSSGYLVKSGKDYVANCEQPCLVSTVYSKENFGDDVDAWEVNCVENQYKNTQQLIRYQRYTPDVESVPSNSYYCVIAHFADGSSEISEVFYKQ